MKKKLEKGSGKIRKYFEKLRRTKMQPTIMQAQKNKHNQYRTQNDAESGKGVR